MWQAITATVTILGVLLGTAYNWMVKLSSQYLKCQKLTTTLRWVDGDSGTMESGGEFRVAGWNTPELPEVRAVKARGLVMERFAYRVVIIIAEDSPDAHGRWVIHIGGYDELAREYPDLFEGYYNRMPASGQAAASRQCGKDGL